MYSSAVTISRNGDRFSLYPNPAKNLLQVNHPAAVEAGTLEIVSPSGISLTKLPLLKGSNRTIVNTQALAAGFYFLRLNNGKWLQTIPFVKQ